MATKYPIILVHGIVLKDLRHFKAFGRIEALLRAEGYHVVTSETDGFGSIETNAEQLKAQILKLMAQTGAEKVNLIAHSKGGLDSRYMMETLDMSSHVASLTCLCTPHKGSGIATKLYRLPTPVKGFIAFWITFWYRIFGDQHPDVLKVCKQLSDTPDGTIAYFKDLPHEGIFLQSYSTTLQKSRDDFVMGIPLYVSRRLEDVPSDGLVSVDSSKFGEYKGNCTDASVSHSEIVDFLAKKNKKEKIYAFYISLCKDLADRGF
ncbi:MAG: alpha/beta fold hydrolase [Ruminococcaceae bacterium]|nr:alpha/beta fold hydrolase [Oscillospiraceae bacterium]